jgi:hypothetical protein
MEVIRKPCGVTVLFGSHQLSVQKFLNHRKGDILRPAQEGVIDGNRV